jgi:hypothetical protein
MLSKPEDLLVRAPDSFASAEGRRAARAFRDAWGCLVPLIPTMGVEEMRHWLAQLTFERGRHHSHFEKLRIEVLTLALAEVRSRKWIA